MTEGESTGPERERSTRFSLAWFWHPDRIWVALTAFIALAALIVAWLAFARGPDKSSQATYNNYYTSANGAPGQADPVASKECGGVDSSVEGGWGPDRPTYLMNHPPAYTTLNSIRNNPDLGDERGFMRVREAVQGTNFTYTADVEGGHTYRVMIYVENSALDGAPELAASGTTVKVNLPTCSGYRIASNAFVDSDSAFPREIWGGVTFRSGRLFNLRYVPGSAHLMDKDNASPGKQVSDDIFTSTGIKVGASSDPGSVLPGYQFAAYVQFDVVAQVAE